MMSRASYIVPFLIGGTTILLECGVIYNTFLLWQEGLELTWWVLGLVLLLSFVCALQFLVMGFQNYEDYWGETPLDIVEND